MPTGELRVPVVRGGNSGGSRDGKEAKLTALAKLYQQGCHGSQGGGAAGLTSFHVNDARVTAPASASRQGGLSYGYHGWFTDEGSARFCVCSTTYHMP